MKKGVQSVLFSVLVGALLLCAGCGKSGDIYTAGVYTASAEGYSGPVTVSRILQARVYVFSIKCVTPIDKPNLRGYNIPAVCTAGISGGVGDGTNGNPKEDP